MFGDVWYYLMSWIRTTPLSKNKTCENKDKHYFAQAWHRDVCVIDKRNLHLCVQDITIFSSLRSPTAKISSTSAIYSVSLSLCSWSREKMLPGFWYRVETDNVFDNNISVHEVLSICFFYTYRHGNNPK